MTVLGVGFVLLVLSVLAYAVTLSGIRVTSQVPLSVVDEVLLGLAVLILSVLTVLVGGVAAAMAATGASTAVQWLVALGVTLLAAVTAAKRIWGEAPRQVQLVQARRDVRAGRAPRGPQPEKGRHQR